MPFGVLIDVSASVEKAFAQNETFQQIVRPDDTDETGDKTKDARCDEHSEAGRSKPKMKKKTSCNLIDDFINKFTVNLGNGIVDILSYLANIFDLNEKVFIICTGAKGDKSTTFDLLNTLQSIEEEYFQLKHCSEESIMPFAEALKILKRILNTNKSLHKLKAFMFGESSLKEGLEKSIDLFERTNNQIDITTSATGSSSSISGKPIEKVFLVLSSGQTEGHEDDIVLMKKPLEEQNVLTVGCHLTCNKSITTRRLYADDNPPAGEGTEGTGLKNIFDLSSSVRNQFLVSIALAKQGWNVDEINYTKKTKLFLQINGTGKLKEITSMLLDIIFNRDALAEVLATVDLREFIGCTIENRTPPNQIGGTCYANAAATVMVLASHRMMGRNPLMFSDLRDEMINKYGFTGAKTEEVLNKTCSEKKLRVQEVDYNGALYAVSNNRPVLVTFSLSNLQWRQFNDFYEENKNGILKDNVITTAESGKKIPDPLSGHAVVLVSYDLRNLKFMNSWGMDWGNNGFFEVEKATFTKSFHKVCYYDVYWNQKDLHKNEIEYFQKRGNGIAQGIINQFIKLPQIYVCGNKHKSKIYELKRVFDNSTLTAVKCPRCDYVFDLGNNGGINIRMYLYAIHVLPRPSPMQQRCAII